MRFLATVLAAGLVGAHAVALDKAPRAEQAAHMRFLERTTVTAEIAAALAVKQAMANQAGAGATTKESWLPMGDWQMKYTAMPKGQTPLIDPDNSSLASPMVMSPHEAGLDLSVEHKNALAAKPGLKIMKQFVYPKPGWEPKFYEPFDKFYTNGGFRFFIEGVGDVGHWALEPLPMVNSDCPLLEATYSERYCPQTRYPQSIPHDGWHPVTLPNRDPFEAGGMTQIFMQYVGPTLAPKLFSPYSKDAKTKHFLGAFVFKKENNLEVEWRCRNPGYGFLQQKNLHFRLHALPDGHYVQPAWHNNENADKKGKHGKHAKAPAPKMTPNGVGADQMQTDFGDITDGGKRNMGLALSGAVPHAASLSTMRFVYPQLHATGECKTKLNKSKDKKKKHKKEKHAEFSEDVASAPSADVCFKKNGGLVFQLHNGKTLAAALEPALQEDAALPLAFNYRSCPPCQDAEKIPAMEGLWQPAPWSFAGPGVEFVWVAPEAAEIDGLFGACNQHDARVRNFGGALVFRHLTDAWQQDRYQWRCLDNSYWMPSKSMATDFQDDGELRKEKNTNLVTELVDSVEEIKKNVLTRDATALVESADGLPDMGQTISIQDKTADQLLGEVWR